MEIAGGLFEKFSQKTPDTIEKLTTLDEALFYQNLFDNYSKDALFAKL